MKIDVQTDTGTRGQFAKFAIQVNLANLLVPKIRVASKLHRVEYKSLPSICFCCGQFGHTKEVCPYGHMKQRVDDGTKENLSKQSSVSVKGRAQAQERVEKEDYGDWMVVEHRQKTQLGQKALGKGVNFSNN